MRQIFLLLLLDKTLVMETAHISSFPSQNCGSEVLPNANCIPSKEDGKKPKETKPTRQTKTIPKLWTASDCFSPLTPLQNQDYITEQVSFNFPLQLPLKSPRKIWWGALQTVSDLSAHIRIQRKIKHNQTQYSSAKQKKSASQSCGNFPLAWFRAEIVRVS